MIKFFRKIRQRLLIENSPAVTTERAGSVSKYLVYAIGEILLVVIGILIALQINNWNEKRKESANELKFLSELKSDFLFSQNDLNKNITKATHLAHNCDSLLALFRLPKDEVEPGRFFTYVRKLGGYSTFNPSNGALNNLISSGNLNIIKNDSLRTHLARWSGILEDVKEDEKRLIEFGDNRMNPIRLQYLNPRTESTYIDPALFENLMFENIVRTIGSSANYIIKNYKILEVEITIILNEINRELSSD
jgi:hypothetical protein